MTPAVAGRFCNRCVTSVTDFTNYTDSEIKDFFQNRTDGVCGRFYKSQIDRIEIRLPKYLLFKRLASWKKFLIVFMFCFSSSVLNFDTYFHGMTLQAQTTSVKRVAKTKANKKKRKMYKYAHLFTGAFSTELITLGFTTVQFCPPIPSSNITILNRQNNSVEETAIEFKEEMGNSIDSRDRSNKAPAPDGEKQTNPIEAILPGELSRKNKARPND